MARDNEGLNVLLWGGVAVLEAAVACGAALRLRGYEVHGVGGVVTAIRQADVVTVVVAAVLLVVMGVATVLVTRWLRRALRVPGKTGTDVGTYRQMHFKPAVERARRILADSMAGKALTDEELVRYAGNLGSTALFAQHEDPETTFAVTRSGKTRLIVVRRVLGAPGPVLATSTKVDAIAMTWLARRRTTGGRTLAFDPMGTAIGPVPVRWNPVIGCEDFNTARQRGRAFTMGASNEIGSGNTRWFMERGAQILGYLFHAAALAGVDISYVHQWVSHPDSAIEVLRDAGTRSTSMMAATLSDLMVEMADETASGFKGTMQGALEPLMIDSVLETLTPPAEESFNAEAFLASKDVLWAVSPEHEGAVASVTTMFVDHVVSTARRLSSLRPGQRLTPPLSLVLDEAANVAPLPDIDKIYSEAPGTGLALSAFFQDEAQVVSRWGREAARMVFQQSRCLYVLGGSKDTEWNERIANLSASFEEKRTSWSSGPTGTSTSTHTERRHVLRDEHVRDLPYGTAVLAPVGRPAVRVTFTDIADDPTWGQDVRTGQARYDEQLRTVQIGSTPVQRKALAKSMEGWMVAEEMVRP